MSLRVLAFGLAIALSASCATPPAPATPPPPPTPTPSPALTPAQAEQAACAAAEGALTPELRSLDAAEDVSGRATSVEVAGTKRLERARVAAVLKTRASSELSAEGLREDAARVFELGGVDDVQVELEATPSGPKVRFVVVEAPELAHVWVHAPEGVSPSAPLPKAGEPYSAAGTARALDLLRESLGKSGHLHATTATRGRRLDDGRVDLCISVDPGPKLLVQSVEIDGASNLGRSELAALRETRGDTANVAGAVLDEELLELDALRMNALYYDRGMIQARVAKEAKITDRGVEIVFRVQEGPIFHLTAIGVAGDLVATKAAYQHAIHAKKGEIFSRARLLEDIERINALHREQRHPDVEVQPETEVDATKLGVSVTLRLRRTAPAEARP